MSAPQLQNIGGLDELQSNTEKDFLLTLDSSERFLDIRMRIITYIALANSRITVSKTENELIKLKAPLENIGINIGHYVGNNQEKISGLLSIYGEEHSGLFDNFIGDVNQIEDLTIAGFSSSEILKGMDEVIQSFITSFFVRVEQILEKRKMLDEIKEGKIQNVQLESLLSYDYLTKVKNKRAYDQFLSNVYYLFEHNQLERITVMLIDLDKFKFINDTFGHGAGDYVLKRFAELMKVYEEKYEGEFCRLGGEEFGFIFKNKTSQEVFEIGEEIQKDVISSLTIEDIEYSTDYHLSITGGIATIDNTNRHVFEKAGQLTRKADGATYIGKRRGRAQMVIDKGNINGKEDVRSYRIKKDIIDIDSIIKGVAFYLPELLVAMFSNQNEIVNKNEPIINLSGISSAHRNYAYLLYKILEEKGYKEYEWLRTPLKGFLGQFLDLNDKTLIFDKIEALIESGKIGNELKDEVMRNKKYQQCPYIDAFLEYLFS